MYQVTCLEPQTKEDLELIEVEENKSRMKGKDGSCYRIKSKDKKLLKLVLEQEKLINLLSDYYRRTSSYYPIESNPYLSVKYIQENRNVEKGMVPNYSPDDYDSPHTPILSFIQSYECVSDSYDEFDYDSIDLHLRIESVNPYPIKVKGSRQDSKCYTVEKDEYFVYEPTKYYQI